MQRKEFCAAVGIDPAAFKLLGNRGYLPFYERRDRKWRNYTPDDQKFMKLAMLLSSVGIPMPEACALVRDKRNFAERLAAVISEDLR